MNNYREELTGALRRRSLEPTYLGGGHYLRLGGGLLAKAEFTYSGGYANGLRLTMINQYAGPIDSVTIHFWELPKNAGKQAHIREEDLSLYVQRPMPDMDALAEKVQEYLNLFRETDNS